ncbi:MAG TPA: ATP-binding protein [Drouetiella sp.]|jgi:two-component system, cell cycle sensor histidine kinase and response regulator CckA
MKKDRVLLIEDNDADALYVIDSLEKKASQYSCVRVQKLSEAIDHMRQNEVDVAILDLSLPDGKGLLNFLEVMKADPMLPVVIITETEDEEVAIKAVRAGAQDFICKKDLSHQLLLRSLRYAIERKQIYEFLRITLSQLQDAMTSLNLSSKASNTGLWFLDLLTDTVTWNEQMGALYGLSKEKIPKTLNDVLELVHVEDSNRVQSTVQSALEKREEWQTNFRVIWEDGSEHELSCHGKTFFDDHGRPTRMAGTCRDISQDRLEEEETKKRMTLLKQREDFTATLTHDLKNPLIGTNQIIEVMLKDCLRSKNSQHAELLAKIKDSNSQLLSLIQNLTEVYRCEHQAANYDRKRVDIIPLINQCTEKIAKQAEFRKIKLETHYSLKSWNLDVDPIALGRVMQNLLDNAIKFSDENSIVKVRMLVENDQTLIEVEDSGVGICPSEQATLFKRFGQGRHGQKIGTGSGLGLYLCKQIIDAHNGEIFCRSQENAGSTFRVVLPNPTMVSIG